jgi:hypothetical protein
MTLGLVLIMVCILLLGDMIGLIPNRSQAVIEGRKALSESLAIQYSVAAQKRGIDSIKTSMRILVERNKDILSAALRSVLFTRTTGSGVLSKSVSHHCMKPECLVFISVLWSA